MRILVAEDDEALRGVLVRGLQESGYVVDAVGDGAAVLAYATTYDYEVVVLDWRMPRMTGQEALAALRARRNQVPVLMLTARDGHADRVAGLDTGADDYLVKPFDFGELLARLRSLQRRAVPGKALLLTSGDLVFDPTSRQVAIGEHDLSLTAIETAILELLLRRAPAVATRRSIALNVWPDETDVLGSNTIDVHLARLRAKIAGSHARIETVRGVGYRIVAA